MQVSTHRGTMCADLHLSDSEKRGQGFAKVVCLPPEHGSAARGAAPSGLPLDGVLSLQAGIARLQTQHSIKHVCAAGAGFDFCETLKKGRKGLDRWKKIW